MHTLRELLTRKVLRYSMHKVILSAILSVAMVGVALAQMEASSASYVIDVDPARYAGPSGQRVVLRVGDQPRNVVLGTHRAELRWDVFNLLNHATLGPAVSNPTSADFGTIISRTGNRTMQIGLQYVF